MISDTLAQLHVWNACPDHAYNLESLAPVGIMRVQLRSPKTSLTSRQYYANGPRWCLSGLSLFTGMSLSEKNSSLFQVCPGTTHGIARDRKLKGAKEHPQSTFLQGCDTSHF